MNFRTNTLLVGIIITTLDGIESAHALKAETIEVTDLGMTKQQGIIVYPSSYFETFGAVTALEMVEQLPGFSFRDSDPEARGYTASAGNVLINQKRPSSKSDQLSSVLGRIPASNVTSIELVSGGTSGYDTGRDTLVANVKLKKQASSTRTFEFAGRRFDNDIFTPSLELVRTTIAEDRSYTVGIDYLDSRWGWAGSEQTVNGEGELASRRTFTDPFTFERIILTANLDQSLSDQSEFRGSGRVEAFDFKRDGTFQNFTPNGEGEWIPTTLDTSQHVNWFESYEFSPVIDIRSASGVSYEITGLARSETFTENFRSQTVEPFETTRRRRQQTQREFLGRVVVTKPLGEQNDIEFGVEMAKNSRDQSMVQFRDEGAGPISVETLGTNGKIIEDRKEIFSTYTHQLTEKIGLEGTLRYEWSTLTREGVDKNERSFSFLKPEVRIRYDATDNRQYRLNAQREVSQLDFGDFLSQVNFTQSNRVNGGNPDLSPDVRWHLEGEVEQRFGNGVSFSIQGFYETIDDVIDRAPVFGGVFDAPANIGDGTRYGGEIELSTSLDFLSIPNARFDATLRAEDSEVIDPVTGEVRPISGLEQTFVSWEYRQGFPNKKMNLNIEYERRGDRDIYRLDQLEVVPNRDEIHAYIETTRIDGLVIRVGADFLFEHAMDREFFNFVGDRSSGQLASFTDRRQRQNAFLKFQVRGSL